MLGSDKSSPSCWVGYLTNFRYTSNNAVYYGNFKPPNTVLTATQEPSTNIRGIYGAQTVVLMTMSSPLTYLADSSALPKRVDNVGNVSFNAHSPFSEIQINPNLTVGATVQMNSATTKVFAGSGGSYGTLDQGGAGRLYITGNNSFSDITSTYNPATITFPSYGIQSFSNFSVSGSITNSITINSSIPGIASTLYKPTGTVSVNGLVISDSTATGAAWYAGTYSTNVSNNSGWIFTDPGVVTVTYMGNFFAFF